MYTLHFIHHMCKSDRFSDHRLNQFQNHEPLCGYCRFSLKLKLLCWLLSKPIWPRSSPMSDMTSFSEIIWFPFRSISFWVVRPPDDCLVMIFSCPSLSRMTIVSSNWPCHKIFFCQWTRQNIESSYIRTTIESFLKWTRSKEMVIAGNKIDKRSRSFLVVWIATIAIVVALFQHHISRTNILIFLDWSKEKVLVVERLFKETAQIFVNPKDVVEELAKIHGDESTLTMISKTVLKLAHE